MTNPANENAPDAGQGIEGNANSIPTKEMSPEMNHTASVVLAELILAELIGADWTDLDDSERECLTVLNAEGIRLNLIRQLAAATADKNRHQGADKVDVSSSVAPRWYEGEDAFDEVTTHDGQTLHMWWRGFATRAAVPFDVDLGCTDIQTSEGLVEGRTGVFIEVVQPDEGLTLEVAEALAQAILGAVAVARGGR